MVEEIDYIIYVDCFDFEKVYNWRLNFNYRYLKFQCYNNNSIWAFVT